MRKDSSRRQGVFIPQLCAFRRPKWPCGTATREAGSGASRSPRTTGLWLGPGQGTGHSFLSSGPGNTQAPVRAARLLGVFVPGVSDSVEAESVPRDTRPRRSGDRTRPAQKSTGRPGGSISISDSRRPVCPALTGCALTWGRAPSPDAIATCGSFRGKGQPVGLTDASRSLGVPGSNGTGGSSTHCRQVREAGAQGGPSGDA